MFYPSLLCPPKQFINIPNKALSIQLLSIQPGFQSTKCRIRYKAERGTLNSTSPPPPVALPNRTEPSIDSSRLLAINRPRPRCPPVPLRLLFQGCCPSVFISAAVCEDRDRRTSAVREVTADERKKRAKATLKERKLREAKKRAAEEYAELEFGACWAVGARCRRGAGYLLKPAACPQKKTRACLSQAPAKRGARL